MTALDVFWDRCEGPIRFGVNDCCMAIADTIVAAGGKDLMASYRGRYSSARGFVRAFRKAGHSDLAKACEAAFLKLGVRVEGTRDFDVAMVGYLNPKRERVNSPAFFHEGFWNIRSDDGMLVIHHSAFDAPPTVYRVI